MRLWGRFALWSGLAPGHLPGHLPGLAPGHLPRLLPRLSPPVLPCLLLGLGLGVIWPAAEARADRVLVFAAASLAGPLDQVAAQWSSGTGHKVALSYAASSVLARQIEAGAPADLFLSANPDWMDYLIQKGAIDPGSRQVILGNQLALVSFRPGSAIDLDAPDWPEAIGSARLAIALTDVVPAGIYARQALEHMGVWGDLSPRVVQSDNVRAALALVASGAAPYGIVYVSDAVADPRVHLRARFDIRLHDPILYPVGVRMDAHDPARDFAAYLRRPEVIDLFRAAGFSAPSTPSTPSTPSNPAQPLGKSP